MATVSLPDSTKFDADSDKISESRPELKKISDAINTIGADYNAGLLGGTTFLVPTEIYAGDQIEVTQPDSAGAFNIALDKKYAMLTCSRNVAPVSTSGGSFDGMDGDDAETISVMWDSVVDKDNYIFGPVINYEDSSGGGDTFTLAAGTYRFHFTAYFYVDDDAVVDNTKLTSQLIFRLLSSTNHYRQNLVASDSEATMTGIITSDGTDTISVDVFFNKASYRLIWKEQGPGVTDPCMKLWLEKIA